ncbi:DUF2182 domain-containing protein [Mesorhizobium ciceri]|uniref:copper chaperone n=1 Tax=Mesorhizobium ciceri TaxID=39645 RepID=UPI0007A94FF0|nr:DUF2182 domain-containing protein [Mesorhizobium ciceri]AMX98795.1 hypothetical protein A4R29_04150 [Mesorhizobium ciceri biovar biserrulae]
MTDLAHLLNQYRPRGLIVVAGGAWLALLGIVPGLNLPSLCGIITPQTWFAADSPVPSLLLLNPPEEILAGWIVMSLAMMLPMAIGQIDHLADRIGEGRLVGQAVFVVSYFGLWLAGCALLTSTVLVFRMIFQIPGALTVALGAATAVLWQESRIKALVLRRCHSQPPIRWSGAGLLVDSTRFGAKTGLWWFIGCWPWMLLCMVAPYGVLTMALISPFLWYERFARTSPFRLSAVARQSRRTMKTQ